MSVFDRFKTLIQRIEPLGTEISKSKTYADSIKTRLNKDFNLKKFELIGSYSRGTAIKNYSDVDYLALLSRDDVAWGDDWISSNTLILKLKESLMGRYPNTNIRRDQQAVVVRFFLSRSGIDIVPGIYLEQGPSNWPLYAIPDGNGNWIKTSPGLHRQYIDQVNEQSLFKLKRVAQLLKYWKNCRTPILPLQSFHIEMILASEEVCVGAKSYATCLAEAFRLLRDRQCRSLQDPISISGYIPAVVTDNQREIVTEAADYAYTHATKALEAEINGSLYEAYRQWDIVFNSNFPKTAAPIIGLR